jgi:hypothetical protein
MRYWWLAWWQARRYSLLASMTCRRYSSAGISNGTPRTSWAAQACGRGIRRASYTKGQQALAVKEQKLQ